MQTDTQTNASWVACWRLLLEQSHILALTCEWVQVCVCVRLSYARVFMSFCDCVRVRLKRQLSRHKTANHLARPSCSAHTSACTCVARRKCIGKVVYALQHATLHATANIFAHLSAAEKSFAKIASFSLWQLCAASSFPADTAHTASRLRTFRHFKSPEKVACCKL